MPASAGHLVELEQQLAGALVQFEVLSEAWPMAPRAVDRASIGREHSQALDKIGSLQEISLLLSGYPRSFDRSRCRSAHWSNAPHGTVRARVFVPKRFEHVPTIAFQQIKKLTANKPATVRHRPRYAPGTPSMSLGDHGCHRRFVMITKRSHYHKI